MFARDGHGNDSVVQGPIAVAIEGGCEGAAADPVSDRVFLPIEASSVGVSSDKLVIGDGVEGRPAVLVDSGGGEVSPRQVPW